MGQSEGAEWGRVRVKVGQKVGQSEWRECMEQSEGQCGGGKVG